MVDISGRELGAAERRIANIANHLSPLPSTSPPSSMVRQATASTGDSYHRVHGKVSTREASWRPACDESGKDYTDFVFEKAVGEGIAKITIIRPERRNAFRPNTMKELIRAFNVARDDSSIGVIILTGKGTKAFCSGGDQALRGPDGYADFENFGRLNVLDLQCRMKDLLKILVLQYPLLRVVLPHLQIFSGTIVQIRRLPKPVIATVAGYAVGVGHILHMVCDLTISADNSIFGQTGPRCMSQMGSFDAGYGSSIMSGLIGPKKACEMFLCRFYDAYESEKMGLLNVVVPELGGNAIATLVFYGTEEANEGKRSYMDRRQPDFFDRIIYFLISACFHFGPLTRTIRQASMLLSSL